MKALAIRKTPGLLFIAVSLVIYVIINGILLYFHEPWCDEAQAWLIARELSPAGIIRQMAYEGHPAMWHFLLLPFAKSGMPYVSMNLLSLTIMIAAAWVLLKFAPFHMAAKICLILSPIFVYYFPVIARSYCLVSLIVVLLAAFYHKRDEFPYIYCLLAALLVQTHIIMLAMAGFLSLFFLAERWKQYRASRNLLRSILPLLLPFISFLLLLLQISGAQKSSAMPAVIDFRNFFMLGGLVPKLEDHLGTPICILLGLVLAGLLLFLIWMAKRINILKEFCILAVSLLFQLFIYTTVYGINLQRAFCGLFIILWFGWVCYEPVLQFMAGRKRNLHGRLILNGIAAGFAVILLFLYARRIYADIPGCYSYAEDIAAAIEEYVPSGTDIITSENGRTASVIPYLKDYRFYSYQTGNYTTYAIWDSRITQPYTAAEMIQAVRSKEKGNGFYLMVPPSSCIPDLAEASADWQLLYQTPTDSIQDEYYSLYYITY